MNVWLAAALILLAAMLPLGAVCFFARRAIDGLVALDLAGTNAALALLLLSEGRAVGQGAPGEVLTRETVARVFAWPVAIEAFDGRPQVVPLRRRRNA